MGVPFVKRTEYQLLNADPNSGEVSLLLESGDTKDDLNLPCFVQTGEPTEEDQKVQKEILDGFEAGKTCIVAVLNACAQEKLVGVKFTETWRADVWSFVCAFFCMHINESLLVHSFHFCREK